MVDVKFSLWDPVLIEENQKCKFQINISELEKNYFVFELF